MQSQERMVELIEWLVQYEPFEQYWQWSLHYEQWMSQVDENALPLWMRLSVASNDANHVLFNHLNDLYPEEADEWYLIYRLSHAYYAELLSTVKKSAIVITRVGAYLASKDVLPDILVKAKQFPEIAMFLWLANDALNHKYQSVLEKESHISPYKGSYEIFKVLYPESLLQTDATLVQNYFRYCLNEITVQEEQPMYL